MGAWLGRKAERERLDREDDRRQADREDRQLERFDDDKRAAFVRYLQLRNEYRRICHRLYQEQHPQERVRRLTDRARYAGSDLEALEEEIGLIDPDIHSVITLLAGVPIRQVDPRDEAGLEEWFISDSIAVHEIRITMRKSLAIASRNLTDLDKPKLSKSPFSGTAKGSNT